MIARILSLLLFLFAVVPGAFALEVRQAEWGFGGVIVPDRFAPLSVLIENPSSDPFDGELALYETRGLGEQVGARNIRPFYLEPGRAKWVQFYPYVSEPTEWMLVWGRGPDDRHEIEAPRGFSAPARVLLVDEENPFDATVKVRTFPAQRFPTLEGATAGLDAVALDHSPRWEPARREAFLAWLRGGGTVHLLRDARGGDVRFPGEMAVLNAPAESFSVERGRVRRHDLARRQLAADFFEENGSPERKVESGDGATIHRFDAGIFQALGALTRPNVNWALILSLTFLYLLLVGPIHYLVGKRYDYRITLGAYLAFVAAFAFLFAFVGRRGYGERTVVHTLSYARGLGGEEYAVTQWASLFVTKGDVYTVRFDSEGELFTTDTQSGKVNAEIVNGLHGQFTADLPLYSSRPYLHSAVMRGDALEVTVESRDSDGKPLKLRMESGPEPLACWVRHQNSIYKTELRGREIHVKDGGPASGFLSGNDYNAATQTMRRRRDGEGPDTEAVMRQMAPLILARGLGGTSQFARHLSPRPLEADEVEVFIFAAGPAGFAVAGETFKRDIGYTLYDVSVRSRE